MILYKDCRNAVFIFCYIWRMNSRWYIGTLVILLAFLGVVANQKQQAPNQEIVLQFTSDEVTSNDTQSALDIVKKQLRRAGVDDIHISEESNGSLKITYYSNTDVSNIKKILLNDDSLDLGCVSTHEDQQPIQPPSEDTTVTYNLDIYEIQKGDNSASSSAGKFALEAKSENNRFVNPNFHFSFDDLVVLKSDGIAKISSNFKINSVVVSGNKSHQIPEVRAGPFSNGMVS
ncbi:hypothetical protein OE09_0788 [Flavobacteriaceae bacterium MAR_2010_72]|nr:hypothetical protein OE09_0788 [Flavobacteriaceae bacterium MAR_2010_72]TVZ57570.1 hypothetical protein NA63_0055 [Flavobacteriaceae bacterium MAR_2010_105]